MQAQRAAEEADVSMRHAPAPTRASLGHSHTAAQVAAAAQAAAGAADSKTSWKMSKFAKVGPKVTLFMGPGAAAMGS